MGAGPRENRKDVMQCANKSEFEKIFLGRSVIVILLGRKWYAKHLDNGGKRGIGTIQPARESLLDRMQ